MKIKYKTNFRVIIEPRSLGDYGFIRISDTFMGKSQERIEKEYLDRCREIEEQIRRHVDNVGYINIEYDTNEVCSFCGENQIEDDYEEPSCCDEAKNEYKNLNQVVT